MIRRRILSCLAFVAMAAAFIVTGAIERDSASYTGTSVVDGGIQYTYPLIVRGWRWKNFGYGYHSSGGFGCEDCANGGPASGLFYWYPFEYNKNDRRKDGVPKTAQERISQGWEYVGYPYYRFEGDDLRPRAYRDDVKIGPLSGYAIIYEVTERTTRDTSKDFRLLVIAVTNSSVYLETAILSHIGRAWDDWSLLESFLDDVTILQGVEVYEKPKPVRIRKASPN